DDGGVWERGEVGRIDAYAEIRRVRDAASREGISEVANGCRAQCRMRRRSAGHRVDHAVTKLELHVVHLEGPKVVLVAVVKAPRGGHAQPTYVRQPPTTGCRRAPGGSCRAS